MIHPTTLRAVVLLCSLCLFAACASSGDAFRAFFAASRAYCTHAPTVEAIIIPMVNDAGSDVSTD